MPNETVSVPSSKAPTPAVRLGPAAWRTKKRPQPVQPKEHDPKRNERVHFDAQFAAAAVLGKWEPEWPLLSEVEFDAAMKEAASIEIGGHWPDGSHPRAPKAQE